MIGELKVNKDGQVLLRGEYIRGKVVVNTGDRHQIRLMFAWDAARLAVAGHAVVIVTDDFRDTVLRLNGLNMTWRGWRERVKVIDEESDDLVPMADVWLLDYKMTDPEQLTAIRRARFPASLHVVEGVLIDVDEFTFIRSVKSPRDYEFGGYACYVQ